MTLATENKPHLAKGSVICFQIIGSEGDVELHE